MLEINVQQLQRDYWASIVEKNESEAIVAERRRELECTPEYKSLIAHRNERPRGRVTAWMEESTRLAQLLRYTDESNRLKIARHESGVSIDRWISYHNEIMRLRGPLDPDEAELDYWSNCTGCEDFELCGDNPFAGRCSKRNKT